MNKKISIVIVCYKSLNLIKDCIDSVIKFNDLKEDEIEIIIIDNSPEPEQNKMEHFLQKYAQIIDIQFIRNKNFGYGHGNNLGIKNANAEIVLIMNPDVRFMEPLLKNSLKHFENPETASLGYRQIRYGGKNYSFFTNPQKFFPFFSTFILWFCNKLLIFNEKIFYISGAFIFFRKKDFLKAGGYDENIFMYFEEPDIALRIRKIGKKNIFDRNFKYYHLHKDGDISLTTENTVNSLKYYFCKYGFNLKKYILRKIFEMKIYRSFCKILNKPHKIKTYGEYEKLLRKILP